MSVVVASCAHQLPEASLPTNEPTIDELTVPTTLLSTEKAPTVATSQDTQFSNQPSAEDEIFSAPIPADLWQRIRRHLTFTDVKHPRIHKHIKQLKRDREIEAMVTRGRPLLHYLFELAEHRGLPAELVLMPMVESGFKPDAVSPGNAAGLWQIRPATARSLGLTVNSRYDGRYDIHASTLAALDYLEYLYRFFDGDWLLAVAAYNCGEGTVQKAMQANQRGKKGTAYWDLDNLPLITRNYVPKVLAFAQIIADPQSHGVNLQPIANQPYLSAIDIDSSIDPFKLITGAAINKDIAFYFNPAFKKTKGASPNDSYKLLLPREQATRLSDRLNNRSGIRLVEWSKQNQNLQRAEKSSSQKLWRHSRRSSPKPSNSNSNSNSNSGENRLTYVVQSGDTIETVARLYGVPGKLLAQWNQLDVDGSLKQGQKLTIKILNVPQQALLELSSKKV